MTCTLVFSFEITHSNSIWAPKDIVFATKDHIEKLLNFLLHSGSVIIGEVPKISVSSLHKYSSGVIKLYQGHHYTDTVTFIGGSIHRWLPVALTIPLWHHKGSVIKVAGELPLVHLFFLSGLIVYNLH